MSRFVYLLIVLTPLQVFAMSPGDLTPGKNTGIDANKNNSKMQGADKNNFFFEDEVLTPLDFTLALSRLTYVLENEDFKAIIAISREGMILASVFSQTLGIRYIDICPNNNLHEQLLEKLNLAQQKGKVLVLGGIFDFDENILEICSSMDLVKTASLFQLDTKEEILNPDYFISAKNLVNKYFFDLETFSLQEICSFNQNSKGIISRNEDGNEKLYLEWGRIIADTMLLYEEVLGLEQEFTSIVALTRGGLFPASILSKLLQIDAIYSLCVASYADDSNKQGELNIIKGVSQDIDDNTLIVEDLIDTGNTLQMIKDMWPDVSIACLYKKPHSPNDLATIVAAPMEDKWLEFPWERPYLELLERDYQ